MTVLRSVVALFLLIWIVSTASSSIVIHDGSPGIVAHWGSSVLDHDGLVWTFSSGVWERTPEEDPPIPVEEIKFWYGQRLVSMDNEAWRWVGSWENLGAWPGGSSPVRDSVDPIQQTFVHPNPADRSAWISFQSQVGGHASVQILDVTGRVIRVLLDGPHPPGDYSLIWDGRDDAGRKVPAGVYLTRIETAEGVKTGRVVVAR
jgi:hypothetical protein